MCCVFVYIHIIGGFFIHLVNCRGTFSASQQALVKLIKRHIDFYDVIIFPFDEIADNQIEFTAACEGIACPTDEIPGLLQIQLQCQRQGNGRSLRGLIIRIVADFGKVLLGQQCLFVNLGIFFTPLIDELQQRFRKTGIGLPQQFCQGSGFRFGCRHRSRPGAARCCIRRSCFR